MGAGQLVFVPSYFDFVRLRNWLGEQEGASWEAVCEYKEAPDVARARSLFAKGRSRLLLYTERLHFYYRHHFRGVQVLVDPHSLVPCLSEQASMGNLADVLHAFWSSNQWLHFMRALKKWAAKPRIAVFI